MSQKNSSLKVSLKVGLKGVILNKINTRVFSSSSSKFIDDSMMSRIDKMIEKNKVLNKNTKNDLDQLNNNTTLDVLKNKEMLRFTEYTQKNYHYLDKSDRIRVDELIEKSERMDNLIVEKITTFDFNKIDDAKKALKLAELADNNRENTSKKIQEIITSSFDKKVSNNSVSKAEIDVFNILSAKRKEESNVFLEFKRNFFKGFNEKLNNTSNNTSDTISKKDYTMIREIKSSLAESSSIPDKVALSEELTNVVLDILNLFS